MTSISVHCIPAMSESHHHHEHEYITPGAFYESETAEAKQRRNVKLQKELHDEQPASLREPAVRLSNGHRHVDRLMSKACTRHLM
jgi:hypothetical protein